jgi:bifunctional oligoribonuclease and PAP phosphatase NrnA
MIDYTQIKSTLLAANNIVITSHQSPDGDAVGSSLAMYNFLKAIGKQSVVILPDKFASYYNWMNGADGILFYDSQKEICEEHLKNADVVFCLDYNDTKRTGPMQAAIDSSKSYKILIDHHPNPNTNLDVVFSDTSFGSTAQMVFEFMTLIGEERALDSNTAACIYCGIMTDTGSFRFSSVNERTHEVVAKLIKTGIKHHVIHEAVYDQNSLDRIRLQGFVLNNQLEHLPELKTTIVYLNLKDNSTFNIQPGDTEGLVNIALSIKGTEVAAFFREDKDKIKISFRSKGTIEVNKLSEKYFDGGGHRNAAGGQSKQSIQEAIALYKSVLHEFL